MTVGELKAHGVKNVNGSLLIQDISMIFKNEDIRYIVVHEKNKVKGIITQREVLDAYLCGKSLEDSINSIISDNFYAVKEDSPVEDILKVIEENPDINIIILNNKLKAMGVITKDMVLDFFFQEVKGKISGFIKEKSNQIKALRIPDVLEYIDRIILWNKELEQTFENSPNAFVVQDGKGNTLRVNKEFENITGLRKEDIIGRNVKDLEEEGVYNPAVGLLVLREKRRISLIQKLKNGREALVTGVPFYDENGNIFRIVINSIDYKELYIINEYYSKQKEENEKIKTVKDTPIIYKSERMINIIRLIDDIKDVDSTVLMTGESGVGKGVLARYIHENSTRKKGKMVEINCGAIPETLLESELLGYEAGAFTGANKSGKPGLIELAHKGTLFLDEIGEMPMQLQVKLLQVIQERKIIRVGGIKPIDVDVRIIAATNKDLQDMVNKEKFRLDLFYRLNVIPINIPALRERKLDIRPMVQYFLHKYNSKYNKNVIIGDSILNTMLTYEWPGNVRELENAVERMVVTNPSTVIEKTNNKCEVFNFNIGNDYYSHTNFTEEIIPLEDAKRDVEKKLINMAYDKYKSSYKVAAILKISQATANRKIREHCKKQNNSK